MEGPAIRWPQPGGHREGPNAKMALWKTGQKNDTFKQFEELRLVGALGASAACLSRQRSMGSALCPNTGRLTQTKPREDRFGSRAKPVPRMPWRRPTQAKQSP
jgi:hypothetical protein